MTVRQKTDLNGSSSTSDPAAFDAVIFDLDGTLVDTETLCNETGVAACETLGHPVSLAFFEALSGIDDVRRAQMISSETGRTVDKSAFFAEWDRRCIHRFKSGVPLKPGVPDLFEAIAARRIPMAICTSSRRNMAEAKIAASGLARFFAAIITVEDAGAPKPDPSPYRVAAAALGVMPVRCLAVEDSETGAASARAAGMTVVQVPDRHPVAGIHAHYVAATIAEGLDAVGL